MNDHLPSEHPSPPRRPWLLVLVLAIAAAAGVAAWRHYRQPVAQKPGAEAAAPAAAAMRGGRRGGFDPNRPMPVVTATARSGDIDVTLSALGTVTPRGTVTVKPRVDGQLVALHFREGETV
ncbi:MAG: MdtA/MuxA family multidrug efflux RND transporter periplasmic adaptor subunit, partial [Burkholderiaceae bacterium]